MSSPPEKVLPATATRVPAWLRLLAIAGGLLILVEGLDALVALPLREISAIIATFLLNSLSLSVERQGTLLIAENFTWDVVPACSGSTSLRVLITSAVIWCGIQPNLNWRRKLFCVLAAIPLALLANGIRVAVLTYVGTILRQPVEGLLHDIIGVAAMMLGMGAVVLLTAMVAQEPQQAGTPRSSLHRTTLAVLLLLLYAPAMTWAFSAWRHSPLDTAGPWFLLAGVACLGLILWRHPATVPRPWLGTVLFAGSMLVLLLATVVDISMLKVGALLLSWFSLIVVFRGGSVAASCLPGLAICYMGFPTVTYQLNTYVISRLPLITHAPVELVKLIVAAILAATSWLLVARARPIPADRSAQLGTLTGLLTVAVIALIAQVLYLNSATLPEARLALELSHFQGDWTGIDLPISATAAREIGRERILSRLYSNGNRSVELLISSTGGDRRRAHAPEYCLTGSGWQVRDRARQTLQLGDTSIETQLLTLRREPEADRWLAYWFTDGRQTWTSFLAMLREDTFRRLRGKVTDWHVIRLIGRSEADLRAFAEQLEFRLLAAPPPSEN